MEDGLAGGEEKEEKEKGLTLRIFKYFSFFDFSETIAETMYILLCLIHYKVYYK